MGERSNGRPLSSACCLGHFLIGRKTPRTALAPKVVVFSAIRSLALLARKCDRALIRPTTVPSVAHITERKKYELFRSSMSYHVTWYVTGV